jgi:hypothetical protein
VFHFEGAFFVVKPMAEDFTKCKDLLWFSSLFFPMIRSVSITEKSRVFQKNEMPHKQQRKKILWVRSPLIRLKKLEQVFMKNRRSLLCTFSETPINFFISFS